MLKVRKYPDPVLARPAQPIRRIDAHLRSLVEEMFETMYREKGVGLAAPQIGQSIRLCVVNPTGKKDDELILINPVIVESTGEQLEEEGCLSVPGIRTNVPRAAHVRVRAYDPDGNELDIEADGLLARVFQHELDHLNGRLFFHRLNDAARMTLRARLKALEDKSEGES